MCEIWREHATWVQLPMMSLLSVSSSPLPLKYCNKWKKSLGPICFSSKSSETNMETISLPKVDGARV